MPEQNREVEIKYGNGLTSDYSTSSSASLFLLSGPRRLSPLSSRPVGTEPGRDMEYSSRGAYSVAVRVEATPVTISLESVLVQNFAEW